VTCNRLGLGMSRTRPVHRRPRAVRRRRLRLPRVAHPALEKSPVPPLGTDDSRRGPASTKRNTPASETAATPNKTRHHVHHPLFQSGQYTRSRGRQGRITSDLSKSRGSGPQASDCDAPSAWRRSQLDHIPIMERVCVRNALPEALMLATPLAGLIASRGRSRRATARSERVARTLVVVDLRGEPLRR